MQLKVLKLELLFDGDLFCRETLISLYGTPPDIGKLDL